MYKHTRSLGTFAAAAFLALVACGSSHAATLTFSAPSNFDSSTNTLNFGSVAVGSTLEVVVTANGNLAVNDIAVSWGNNPGGSNLPLPFSYVDEGDPVLMTGCYTGHTTCNIDYFFTPTTTGNFSTTQNITFTYDTFVTSAVVRQNITETITLEGTGVATTPLPAALPLFATGLGGLGLLGWRRKRKVEGA